MVSYNCPFRTARQHSKREYKVWHLARQRLKKTAMIKHILVVCVGNICRSPMAEALLKRELRARTPSTQEVFTVHSAGLGALVGQPASAYAVELVAEIGEDITGHRARQIHSDMVREADLVLVMEAVHKRMIDEANPTARGKVYRLGEWQDKGIDDPYGQPKSAYEQALAGIEAGVAQWVERIRA